MGGARTKERSPLLQDEHTVQWWALGALDLPNGTDLSAVRKAMEGGQQTDHGDPEFIARWETLKALSAKLAGKATADEFARSEPKMARVIAKSSPRAFMELCDIRDDDDEVVCLAAFHLRALQYVRGHGLSVVLLPFMTGKSWLANIAVPLLDWSWEKEATQVRIYASQDHVSYWIRKLMDQVEHNKALQHLFPHIRRPERGDPCEEIWSTVGFSLGSKKIVGPSFKPLTVGSGRVGLRGDRNIGDDWVTSKNCSSRKVQDTMWAYFHDSAMTFRTKRGETWPAPHDPRGGMNTPIWGTTALVGTIFDKRDTNSRLYRDWEERIEKGDKERKILRIGMYPRKGSREVGETIWPQKRPFEYVQQLERELGQRAFRQRCMNLPFDDDEIVFREDLVHAAFRDDLTFGEIPRNEDLSRAKVMIGFDPGVGGDRAKGKKFPAAVVMAFPDDNTVHVLEWGRWNLAQPSQCRKLVEWSHRYDCSIVVESNATQRSYSEWIAEIDPGVHVINHNTGSVKHDRQDGVESFQPLFENKAIFFHCAGVTENAIREFKEEWLDWPQGTYTDLMMASWICRYQYRRLKFSERFKQGNQNFAPTFARNRGGYQVVDLRAYR